MSAKRVSEQERRLRGLFAAAITAASPKSHFKPLPSRRVRGKTLVLGAGKAAASMAAAFEDAWGLPVEGLVVTRYGHSVPTRHVEVVEAAHPIPDTAGLVATRRIHRLAKEAGKGDLVVFLGSGGMSSLLVMPAANITLEDKQDVSARLLRSGAPIHEINAVRTAMSAIKGGRLAAASEPARLWTYLISDVPGDEPSVIGSGPTVWPKHHPDPYGILKMRGIDVRQDVLDAMRANRTDWIHSRPKVHVIARAKDALAAAARLARSWGWRAVLMGDDVEGEAREVALSMATIVRKVHEHCRVPTVILSGGETTVTVRGSGKGGRNMEFLLALAVELDGLPGVHAISCDTDGIDGATDDAGAYMAPDSTSRIRAAGLDPEALLAQNDAAAAFAAAGGMVTTGPTLTNVNDFRAILVEPAPR